MKKILALTAIVASFGLVACSDDDSGSSSVSCTMSMLGEVVSCIESSDWTEADCTEMGGTVVSACPGNAVATCRESEDGRTATVYDYTEGATCADEE